MNKMIKVYCKGLELLIALALFVMVVLVFGNVVLRYAFNSGITVSEEVSRWLFVWMVFLGSIVALHEGGHLGSDMLVSRLPTAGKKICFGVGHLLMLYISWLLFSGALEQVKINLEVTSPMMGASLSVFYMAGVVFAVSAGLMLVAGLWRLLSGHMADSELVMVQESEESAEIELIQARIDMADDKSDGRQAQATKKG